MLLFSTLLLAAFTIWAVVWSTDYFGVTYAYAQSKKRLYYITGLLFYWPSMVLSHLLCTEKYRIRFFLRYWGLHLITLLMLATFWVFTELYGLRATVLAVVGWGLFGQIVMFFRYGNVRVVAQAACAGLTIAFLLVGCSWVWCLIPIAVFFLLWVYRGIPCLLLHFELSERRAYI